MKPFLYHGTSTAYLDGILRNGLQPESSYKGYICYADDIEISVYHAGFMAKWDEIYVGRKCYPVIFRIPFLRFDASCFCLDQNFIELGPSAGRAVGMDMQARSWTWRSLLTATGAVGYAATMGVTEDDIMKDMEMAA